MNTDNPLLDKKGTIKPEARTKIELHATKVECECPTHLFKIVDAITSFQIYETECLINDLKQREIHHWLLEASHDLEVRVSEIIIELMRKEGFMDAECNFLKPPAII